jgi:hypothetical protein
MSYPLTSVSARYARLTAFAIIHMLFSSLAVADLKFTEINPHPSLPMAGGLAAADYDGDGDVDLYLVADGEQANLLLQNDGSGNFNNVSAEAGVALPGHAGGGPAFGDTDGDGWPDLFVGGMNGSGGRMFRNNGDGTFSEVTEASGIYTQNDEQNDFSPAFGDPDGDGDLDLFVSRWGTRATTDHLWLNRGSGRFIPADELSGIDTFKDSDLSFSPVFTDINGDGIQDLLVASDNGNSQVFINKGRARFESVTTDEIDDEFGMGQAAADFDNDGDMDWFVTSVHSDGGKFGGFPASGNRLYRNDSTGGFTDVSEEAGVREGYWGWGACAADFDNDGWLDIFHVNGMAGSGEGEEPETDPSRLFINNRDGTFSERSSSVGLLDEASGRGVACLDHDGDGDIDIAVSNSGQAWRLYRNDLQGSQGFLQIRLEGSLHPSAVGARIAVRTGELWQTREVTIGSNFQSQNPLIQHFGLGNAESVDEVRVSWPFGGETVLRNLESGQSLVIRGPEAEPPPFVIEAGTSSAWFDPAHDGEGFVLEILSGNRAVLYWFTYNQEGEQDWYIAVGEVQGNRVLFDQLVQTSGGVFGPDYDPDKIKREVVGSAAFSWASCDRGFMDWTLDSGGDGIRHGRQELQRLSRLMGVDCGHQSLPPERPEGLLSGSWYDPDHDGEGYVLEVLIDGRVLVFWFTYGPDGKRRWFFNTGEIRGKTLVFDELLSSSGGVFGEDFDPEVVEFTPWGSLELEIDCRGGQARYSSTLEGFGNGSFNLQRLSQIEGLNCDG